MKLLKHSETAFHAMAIGIILHSLIYKGEVTESALAASAAISALGRVVPTEQIDKQFDIPLGSSQSQSPPDP